MVYSPATTRNNNTEAKSSSRVCNDSNRVQNNLFSAGNNECALSEIAVHDDDCEV